MNPTVDAVDARFRDRRATVVPPLALLLFHLSFLRGYGVFRDEPYYLTCGNHPAWGYVDHPPMVAWAAWVITHAVRPSHIALRVVSALVRSVAVVLVGQITLEFGGGRFAQWFEQWFSELAFGLTPICCRS